MTTKGAGAFGWIDPPYTDAGMWPTYVMRFRPSEPSMEKIEAPDMERMQALTLSGYGDIWFAGKPYGPDMGNVIVNYYHGKWFYYPDPSPYGMDYLHLFSHANGWAFDENRIYRFDGQSWDLWLELAAFQSIKPCAFKSPTNVWAVGYPADASYKGNTVLHYEGGGWREVFRPGENKYVYDVAMLNNYNGWAVGAEKVGTHYYGRTWQFRNGVWHERVCPVEESVGSVEVVSKTEAWALTYDKILHYTTESNVVPASLGRVKALYAAGRGGDSLGSPSHASPVPVAP
ncbi:MAG: hypothetical protein V3W11_06915, partial [bacterium]